jgi:predicted lysophospholipase L1 biosynthesis ABC-type transport system permease subunit
VYVPVQPSTQQSMMLVARTDGDPAAALEPLRRAVHEIAPLQPVTPLQPLPRLIADSAAQPRFTWLLLTFFAAATLLLAGVGLYGVLAFAVARRTREIGVRMALGARPRSVRGLIVRQSLGLTALGLLAGAVVALEGARALDSMLFELRPHDASILAAVATLLLLVALLAAWVPARWATRIAPAEALRAE